MERRTDFGDFLRFPTETDEPSLHLAGCTFGNGRYRVVYLDHTEDGVYERKRWFADEVQARSFHYLLPPKAQGRIQRDACMDGVQIKRNDARTPDVVDAGVLLGMARHEAMEETGLTDDADYGRLIRDLEPMLAARENREAQGRGAEVQVPVLVRRKKTAATKHLFAGGGLVRIRGRQRQENTHA